MAPSHLLFGDDIFVFTNGNTKCLKHLSKWLEMYQESSGQIFSSEKSKLFLGAMSITKKQRVKAILGFDEGCLPTTYLSIPLVQGRVTRMLLCPLVEKIKRRATGWAGSLLSLQGRVVLVQSVLSSISIYNMGIYKWPASLIKEGEIILCNFFWSGEPDSRKACVVAWDKVCKFFKEGGINLRRLKAINQSLMMKLSWNFLNPADGWSEFMRAKFISKSGNFSRITKGSSIWAGVRGSIEDVRAHSGWVIGNGASIDLWRDNWCSSLSLKDWINDDHIPWNDLHAKLSSIIVEGRWAIPGNLQLLFQRLGVDIHSIKINKNNADRRVWKPDLMGKFSVKGAFEAIRNKDRTVWWASFLSNKAIHHRLTIYVPTQESGQKPLLHPQGSIGDVEDREGYQIGGEGVIVRSEGKDVLVGGRPRILPYEGGFLQFVVALHFIELHRISLLLVP
ncbi:hypothetical protein GIB67_034812 [Kingdonia uniflora]|uniref:Reverse transcriptase domain-containing protein n=1 Tax=Kingdonia uniflora TaxID=39325 RepID=A0A7J7ME70_9MAGN|nr:hypothetical protein GIB67_034812 [Kingdonia uniflora]